MAWLLKSGSEKEDFSLDRGHDHQLETLRFRGGQIMLGYGLPSTLQVRSQNMIAVIWREHRPEAGGNAEVVGKACERGYIHVFSSHI